MAYTRFRDVDGVTRVVERAGRTKQAAIAALQDEVHKRAGAPVAPLRPHHMLERAAEMWQAKLAAQVADGARSATWADTYLQRLRSVILPAMGQWRLHECTYGHLGGFFRGFAETQGFSVAEDGPDGRVADPAARCAARGDPGQPGAAPGTRSRVGRSAHAR
ncbi:hypothetical protein WEH80_36090 [Actinomycetes bacterium KLBMP 9759]